MFGCDTVTEHVQRHLIIILHDHQSQFAFLEIQTRYLWPNDRRELNKNNNTRFMYVQRTNVNKVLIDYLKSGTLV